ncbi:DoxX family protein [Kitasatospora sp. NPDC127059]|uniref:DoxX family protein n=1 Tax=unclassified Kitasatospora TaxID=2633591 RepID=UPI00364EC458
MSLALAPLSERARPLVLGLFRIVVSLLFVCHGAATLFGVLGGAHGKAPEVGEWPGWWAAVIQMAGGFLVLVGLAVRPAALVCSGSMAYAYFSVHQEHGLWPIQNGGEPSVMFCWAFLLIAAVGPGALALGRVLRRAPAEPALSV